MECIRCGNKDPTYFYRGHNGYYCRKCVRFKRLLVDEDLAPLQYEINSLSSEYNFLFSLTSKQKEASSKCKEYCQNEDVLLYCVTGAGKTEISVESIACYLSKGMKVCYAIARKEVVIELSERFKNIFTNAKVIGVYGGHHQDLVADLIVCTTHQLYRYHHNFDLLILDEVDAYPLKGNKTLMNIALRSCKGHIIFSSATIDSQLREVLKTRKYKTVELYVRPSNKPLIIPRIFFNFKLVCFLYLYYLMHSMTNQCIIFVQSKKLCEILYKIYSKTFSCTYVYSSLDERNKNIIDFKNKKYKFIFSTTVLERGITIKDINVVILDFIKNIFDESSYIQMLGRLGRNIDNPYGDAYVLTNYLNKNVNHAIKYIQKANSYL